MRALLVATLLLFAVACAGPTASRIPPTAPSSQPARGWPEVDRALERSVAWLFQKQSSDGAWRSEHYRALADGRALTPMVLAALYFAARVPGLDDGYRRGSEFVASLVGPDGRIDEGPYGLEYPVYTLSLSLLTLAVPENTRHAARIPIIAQALRARRLDAANGWSPADLQFGGWGYYHDLPKKPAPGSPKDELLTSNLGSTLFAAGALQLAGADLDEPLFAEALTFVERCQNFSSGSTDARDDGGFFFTPTDDIPNKAGRASSADEPARYRSYGTATADGLRALLRLGLPRDDARVQAAMRWLLGHYTTDQVPGDYPPDQEIYRASALHYWLWTSSHALFLLGPEVELDPKTRDWPEQVARTLLARQAPDGSFVNDAADLREDDPLVATPLATAALALARMARTGAWKTALEP